MKIAFYQDYLGDWRWRVRDEDDTRVADSGQSYDTRDECEGAFHRLIHTDNYFKET